MQLAANIGRSFQSFLIHRRDALSYVGLAVGLLCFAASLTPSLLPRHYAVQGVLSGITLAVGYGLGCAAVLIWLFFHIPTPKRRARSIARWLMSAIAVGIAIAFLSKTTGWQNSVRSLMQMPPVESAYPLRVAGIAIVVAIILLLAALAVRAVWRAGNRRLSKVIPERVSFVVTTVIVAMLAVLTINKVFARLLLRASDGVFLALDEAVDDGDTPPADPLLCGSSASLIEWESIGRRGKDFLTAGPTQDAIEKFLARPAKRPIRVYAGYRTTGDVDARAKLALEELIRVGGFDRSILIVATPTGTGWLDPGAVDTVEYLHAGDTAIVAMGYSYLPSWMTLMVDPDRSRASARALFAEVYGHWKTLPHDRRPKLYLHGLSLGSLGGESCTDLYTLIADPIHGAVFSGPPCLSPMWNQITHDRNPDSPSWLPRFHDGSVVRFTAQRNALDDRHASWGPMRFVYIQYASDPMVFFTPDMFYREPAWLQGPRGPDVSPELRWYPVVTFLQVAFDLSMATSVPAGYGHNYHADSYIDAWVSVTDPPGWTEADTRKLKAEFADKAAPPTLVSP